ncbi:MAG: TlpA disulfide reductase family protein [Gemmatimonadota bacterium]|nr:TlpA disulfide reductase family protein [Gemmatimonadota bacterium]
MNTYCNLLMAILIASSACLASVQGQPSVAIITGEIRNPTSREITLDYELPSALESSEQRVVLDSLDHFAFKLPVVRGTRVRAYCEGERLTFFVEPGDSLDVVVEEGAPSFSGPNADNNRFLAELLPRFRSPRLDYEDLQVEDFSRQADQWLQDQLEFLAEEREKYALSPGFIDYATAYFNYEWASLMISYPTEYRRASGHDNGEISPEYYDFFEKIPLVNEKAIGVGDYRTFLKRTLDWELRKLREESGLFRGPKFSEIYDLSSLELSEETLARLDSMHEASRRPSLSQIEKLDLSGLSEVARAQLDSLYEHHQPLKLFERIDLSSLGLSGAVQARLDSITTGPPARKRFTSFSARYDLAKEKLEGRVLYWFLAEELIRSFERGIDAFASVQRKWEDFQEINPYPEYNEAVQAVMYKALKLQPGQPAPDFTLHDLDGQPVSLSQFKGKVILLDFWASWCGPCIGDLPDLRRIKEKTADWPVVFLNLSIDTDDAAWREAVDKYKIKGVHVRADGLGSDVAKSYQVAGIPSYYLVDSQGLIVERPSVSNIDEIVATIEKSL